MAMCHFALLVECAVFQVSKCDLAKYASLQVLFFMFSFVPTAVKQSLRKEYQLKHAYSVLVIFLYLRSSSRL